MVRYKDASGREWSAHIDARAVRGFETATGIGFFNFAFEVLKGSQSRKLDKQELAISIAQELLGKFSIVARLLFHSSTDKEGEQPDDFDSFSESIFEVYLDEALPAAMQLLAEYFPEKAAGKGAAVPAPFKKKGRGRGKTSTK